MAKHWTEGALNSKAELKSYLAGLSPEVLKRFRLQRALRFSPAG